VLWPFVAVRLPGQGVADHLFWPVVTEELGVRLEADEAVSWQGRVEVSGSRSAVPLPPFGTQWSLRRPIQCLITDRRIAYTGDSLTGPGAELTRLRWAQAEHPKGGSALAGQVRFDWVERVFAVDLPFVPLTAVGVTCTDAGRPVHILLAATSGREPQPGQLPLDAAEALASDIARARLAAGQPGLPQPVVDVLTRQRDQPTSHQEGSLRVWEVPGIQPIGGPARPAPVAPQPAGHPAPGPASSGGLQAGGNSFRFGELRTSPGRLTLADAVVFLLLFAVLAFTARSGAGLKTSGDLANLLRQGSSALAQGDHQTAAERFYAAWTKEPRSITAHAGLACSEWPLGYRDEAVSHVAAAVNLGAGIGYLHGTRCFFAALGAHGFRLLPTDIATLVYATPRPGDRTEAKLESIARASSPGGTVDWAWRVLAVACLNHRHDYRLLASRALKLALNLPPNLKPSSPRPPLIGTCVKKLQPHYRIVQEPGGIDAVPRDIERRAFKAPG
jgi:hypothetical protein